MTKAMLAALVLSLSFSAQVFAAEETAKTEGETTMKIEDAADQKNKVSGDIDEEITNKKLRAESGSKSKFSLSLDVTYTGGSVKKPFAASRPDIYGEPGTQDVTSMSVGPDIRYRWSKNDSLTFGTNIDFSTPFQGDVTDRDPVNVGDPSVGYSYVGKIGEVQSIIGAGLSYATSPESLGINKLGAVSASWVLMRSWQNGLSIGLSSFVGTNFYTDESFLGDGRTAYSLGALPLAEYEINDTFSLRTVARYTWWRNTRGDKDPFALLLLDGSQSFGVGMSIARDIYLYPNVQFLWEDLTSDRTNVGMTATINVF